MQITSVAIRPESEEERPWYDVGLTIELKVLAELRDRDGLISSPSKTMDLLSTALGQLDLNSLIEPSSDSARRTLIAVSIRPKIEGAPSVVMAIEPERTSLVAIETQSINPATGLIEPVHLPVEVRASLV